MWCYTYRGSVILTEVVLFLHRWIYTYKDGLTYIGSRYTYRGSAIFIEVIAILPTVVLCLFYAYMGGAILIDVVL